MICIVRTKTPSAAVTMCCPAAEVLVLLLYKFYHININDTYSLSYVCMYVLLLLLVTKTPSAVMTMCCHTAEVLGYLQFTI